jgi:8-oxo-dGTP pyrophosphatase MutT (NUDIX family)
MSDSSHPRVGVGVLLTDDQGRVFLTLRNRPPEAGCWSIVGRKMDFLGTLARERVMALKGISSELPTIHQQNSIELPTAELTAR